MFKKSLVISLFFVAFPSVAFASSSGESSEHHIIHFGIVFAMLAIVLMAGKVGNVIERIGIPAVLGELLAGIVLAALGYFGLNIVGEIQASSFIAFVASFGALLLLFSIGLESKLNEITKVGFNALIVALIGVALPFIAGAFLLAPIFYAHESTNAHLFLGASLVATSVGITASVFKSMNILKTRAAQTVLGAAVIDDVLGLVVLAIVSALASGSEVSSGLIIGLLVKSIAFLAGSVILGSVFAKPISKMFRKIHTGLGMKVALAISFALVFGYLAELFGLEPIIGAFAAGLLLEEVHFRDFDESEVVKDLKSLEFKAPKDREKTLRIINKHQESHVEDLINNIGLIFIPVFFVYTGLQIDFGSLLNPSLYVTAVIISIFAVIGKVVAGIAAKGSWNEKLLVGMSMVPRGEVGLLFAAVGKSLGVLSTEMFSVIILVVIITTFLAPPLIKKIAQRTYPEKV
ncbi:cation:proton antiporter [Candidatus Saccharibacteria bacterium]|nr:cation:proton antiporter [Candidatus Saccharibacteria bacterium]